MARPLMHLKSSFKAAWWLSNPHFQTIVAKLFRSKEQLDTTTETLNLPDGDFVDLAWTSLPPANNTRPIVVILHGLAGSVESHYAKGMLKTIKQKGWIGVLMHFRGCSGRVNKMPNAYHSGDIKDISYLSEQLKQRYQHCPFALIGFSLGGNVATKYLAQTPNSIYQVSAVICAPLHLASCSERINQGFSKLYQKHLVTLLKDSTLEKVANKTITSISANSIASIKTMWDFDQTITAPLNGFKSAEHYYQESSGIFVLTNIKQTCLFIHASDDPFLNNHDILPKNQLPHHLHFEVCTKGGHVGFITGKNPLKPQYWLEQRVPNFLEQYL